MSMFKHLMSGNEAIARGAYEAGVKVCSAYPGTPSTEITENIVKYEDIYAVTSSTSFAWSTYLDPYYSKAITFTPPESGNYTFELTGELDTYIYIIDPRSTEMLEFGVDYDDNSGVDDNAKLTISLDANVPYLVVYSTYDPSTLPETTYVVLSISKN